MLLFPIALLYGLVIRVRNLMFNINILKSESFPLPVVSVGNITVGGTGKTPVTEFVIGILKEDYKIAFVSRGYKRETKGVVMASASSTAAEIGDEPKQILDKFADVKVTVAEKRAIGIKKLLDMDSPPDAIVLDDAYQHRYVKPGLNILIIDFNRPIWCDLMLPAGDLREPMNGKKRADIILFSKCPENLTGAQQSYFLKKINASSNQKVYFSTVGYQKVKPVFEGQTEIYLDRLNDTSVLSVSGIANPIPFENYMKAISSDVCCMRFPDHHQFNLSDIEKMELQFSKIQNENKLVLTTEKDAVRFRQVLPETSLLAKYLYFIPIKIKILNNKQEEFKDKIITYVKQNKRNR
ncbi:MULTISPECIES: tetraacyldisaccharide 4'-kinase [unclassified Saccharicrinis]|uniref:tetraacyldisaccharide 4'-kinase n=1 Tax=unclassified Saccharicrinis TaxID=2646859 RepID=UPI003D330CA6